jgi:hypothetical protein
MHASHVGAILVITQPPRAKISFAPTEKRSHASENRYKIGQTALCPKCGIDAVIGSKSGYPMTQEFLQAMEKHWFSAA